MPRRHGGTSISSEPTSELPTLETTTRGIAAETLDVTQYLRLRIDRDIAGRGVYTSPWSLPA